MRSKLLCIIALTLSPASLMAQDLSGLWRTEATDQGHLEIAFKPCGAALCGTVVGARDRQGNAGDHKAVGKRMIWDMKPTSTAGSWKGGKIWDPRNDKTFNSRMNLENGQLKVAGCFLGICQSQIWRRVK